MAGDEVVECLLYWPAHIEFDFFALLEKGYFGALSICHCD
jgi:hypothetical protein